MNLLLDTHIFIWWAGATKKLSAAARAALDDKNNTLFLSPVTVWEMQLKIQTNKLALRLPLYDLVEEQKRINNLQIFPIKLSHIYELVKRQFHRKDPFDRLLIAQAVVEDFTLVTADPQFSSYSVKIL